MLILLLIVHLMQFESFAKAQGADLSAQGQQVEKRFQYWKQFWKNIQTLPEKHQQEEDRDNLSDKQQLPGDRTKDKAKADARTSRQQGESSSRQHEQPAADQTGAADAKHGDAGASAAEKAAADAAALSNVERFWAEEKARRAKGKNPVRHVDKPSKKK